MLDRHKFWRLFVTSLPLQALTIGMLAALLAHMLWLAATATFTALDWTVYDTWLWQPRTLWSSSRYCAGKGASSLPSSMM